MSSSDPKFKNLNLYIFRHGQTIFSKQNIPYGDKVETADILAEGKPITTKLASYLKNIETEVNFCSPYKRCRQTVEIVEDITKKTFTYDPRLGEFNNESFENFAQRIKNFLDELVERNLTNVAICTHGGVISGIIKWMTENHFYESEIDNFPRCGTLTIIKNCEDEFVDFN